MPSGDAARRYEDAITPFRLQQRRSLSAFLPAAAALPVTTAIPTYMSRLPSGIIDMLSSAHHAAQRQEHQWE
jgi:hypothetical protein